MIRGGSLCSAAFFTPLSKINHILLFIPSLFSLSLSLSLSVSAGTKNILSHRNRIIRSFEFLSTSVCMSVCWMNVLQSPVESEAHTHTHTHTHFQLHTNHFSWANMVYNLNMKLFSFYVILNRRLFLVGNWAVYIFTSSLPQL